MVKINENIIICGIVKNCENKIKQNLDLAIATGNCFNQYKIVIYENNSSDNTVAELNKYSDNNNIIIISENIDISKKENFVIWSYTEITGSDHPCRIEMISNARNKVLNEINNDNYSDYSYVIWIDMDSSGWDILGIIDSFNKKDLWDVVYSNNKVNYYDIYALRCETYPFGPEIIGEYFWLNLPRITIEKNNSLIPVYSAFGGIGIYKKELFKLYNFDFIVNNDVKTFYRNFIKNNINKYDENILNLIKHADKKFPNGYKDEELDIFWKSNSGYNKPVICEHVAFNLALTNNGYRLCINPKMFYNR
jgi:hypothetical protein